MDSINIEYEDLFDDDDDDDEVMPEQDSGSPPVVHDERSSGDAALDKQVQQKLKEIASAVVKKRTLRPQPKLDSSRLTGERGLIALPKQFKNVKFRGRGHEVEDLNTMMQTIEHWAHRLYPNLSFDEIINKIEILGSKKAVQTYVNRIRLDLENVEVPNDNVETRGSEDGVDQSEFLSLGAAELQADSGDRPLDNSSTELQASLGVDTNLPATEPAAIENSSDARIETVALTDEQRAKIQRNKEAALQRRKVLMPDDGF